MEQKRNDLDHQIGVMLEEVTGNPPETVPSRKRPPSKRWIALWIMGGTFVVGAITLTAIQWGFFHALMIGCAVLAGTVWAAIIAICWTRKGED